MIINKPFEKWLKIFIAAAKPCFVDKPVSQYFLIGKLCFIFCPS